MVIKINYTSSDVYVSTSVSPVYVVVNYSGTTTGAAIWGQITGTLSDQTDLQTALDDKVPYTGATANVDLGGFSIKPSMVQITGINSGGTGGVLNLKKGNTRVIGGDDAANNISLWAETGAFGFNDWTAGNTRDAKFSLLSITNNATRTYTLPNLDGTLALLSDIPSLTGFVPYTGATTNVDLGTHRILAQNATIASSGSGDTVTLTHSSGSGIGLNITKGGSGEGLYINKTSGSGNAATIIGTLNATTLVKSGGTSSQFLKADGSVDSTTYVGGSGTSGQVAYWNGTSSQTGSNNLFWDAANARLGIGTNSPQTTLHIQGGLGSFRVLSSGAEVYLTRDGNNDFLANGGTSAELSIGANNALKFLTGSTLTERGRFTAAGRLLLGTTTESTFLLDVNGTGRFSVGAKIGSNFQIDSNGDAYQLTTGGAALWSATANTTYPTYGFYGDTGIGMYRASADILAFATNASERMRITSGGNLLVGTTTDAGEKFQVNGTARFTSRVHSEKTINSSTISNSPSDASFLLVAPTTTNYFGGIIGWAEGNLAASISAYDDGTGGALGLSFATGNNTALAERLKISSTGAATFSSSVTISGNNDLIFRDSSTYISSPATDTLRIITANTERLRITSGGNLLVGTTSDNGSRLQVSGAATFSSSVTATSFIKSGGTSAQILAADGSVITAGTNITISGGTISSSGGGGSVDELQVALISQVYG